MSRQHQVRAGSAFFWVLVGFVAGAAILSVTIASRCSQDGRAALFHSDNSIKCEVERVPVPAKA